MVRYIAGPRASQAQAIALARREHCAAPVLLRRRGTRLGWIAAARTLTKLTPKQAQTRWRSGLAVYWPGILKSAIQQHQAELRQTARFVADVTGGADPAARLARAPFHQRISHRFDLLGSYCNEGDQQEIATVEFDALRAGRVTCASLWMKAAWLSFDERDPSMRLRFSYGIADIDDVSRNIRRQRYAAELAQALFPECALVTENASLRRRLRAVLSADNLEFLERILYFNAPNGGAQFHHDVERAHRGVIFAQVTGRTAWLALPKTALVDEVITFCSSLSPAEWHQVGLSPREVGELRAQARSARTLAPVLDQPDTGPLEHLLNRVPAFTAQLVERGFGFLLQPGDVLLLPQESFKTCCWHAVFCAGPTMGQALSFAMRTD